MRPALNWLIITTAAATLHYYCSTMVMVNCSRTYIPYSDSEILKLTQSPAGSDARLRCGIKEYHADHMNSSEVQWYFKPCGEGTNRTSCHNRELLDQIPWRPIDCENRRCRVTLFIKNTSESDSGLYRCSIHPYRTNNQTQFDIQLVRTFQLDVIKSLLDETVPAPELLDNLPANMTALLDSQIVLQCRVYSKVQPSIKWFRRINLNNPLEDHNFNQDKSIRYLENFYELLPSSGEKPLSDDVYLSKLILHSISERDTGIYVCVGINYGGISTADAYVNVVHPNGTSVGGSSSMADLMVLFLIPLGLAVIPLAVWICFIVLKRRNDVPARKPAIEAEWATDGAVGKQHTNGSFVAERETPVRYVSKARHKRNLSPEGPHLYEKINIM
ncbi:fibroblast growth factor receptor-like 1 [Malaya genurostris]|uniref:fibroblast growth factor receptor-like 1 n=1 Tax=Malaya genurostris TaxID=325434 RepID=UPI0026F3B2B1|nr:fibroblast growth factor receptor-like 1 [Malaya genurostris]XP_058464548.1 fibroblast growth factor receptor-like 1 [Malaya genurostris]XP_058464554.1 fibroblast growth factor receptor-like 1 [Malaya genurostris]XP_058464562.1 fibroblast growth factor receptor-like 1 [Malaya genurostris]